MRTILIVSVLTFVGCTYNTKTDITCVAIVLDQDEQKPEFTVDDCVSTAEVGNARR